MLLVGLSLPLNVPFRLYFVISFSRTSAQQHGNGLAEVVEIEPLSFSRTVGRGRRLFSPASAASAAEDLRLSNRTGEVRPSANASSIIRPERGEGWPSMPNELRLWE